MSNLLQKIILSSLVAVILCCHLSIVSPASADTDPDPFATQRETISIVCKDGDEEVACTGLEEGLQFLGFIFSRAMILIIFVIGGGTFISSTVASSLKGVMGLDFSNIGQQVNSAKDKTKKWGSESSVGKGFDKWRKESEETRISKQGKWGANLSDTNDMGIYKVFRQTKQNKLERAQRALNQSEQAVGTAKKGEIDARESLDQQIDPVMQERFRADLAETEVRLADPNAELDEEEKENLTAKSAFLKTRLGKDLSPEEAAALRDSDRQERVQSVYAEKRREVLGILSQGEEGYKATKVSQAHAARRSTLLDLDSRNDKETLELSYLNSLLGLENKADRALLEKNKGNTVLGDFEKASKKREADAIEQLNREGGYLVAAKNKLAQDENGQTTDAVATAWDTAANTSDFSSGVGTLQNKRTERNMAEEVRNNKQKVLNHVGDQSRVTKFLDDMGRLASNQYTTSKERVSASSQLAGHLFGNNGAGTIDSLVSMLQAPETSSLIRDDEFKQLLLMDVIRKVDSNGDVSSVTNLLDANNRVTYAREAYARLSALGKATVSEGAIREFLDSLVELEMTKINPGKYTGGAYEGFNAGQYFEYMASTAGNERALKLGMKAQIEDRVQTLSRSVSVERPGDIEIQAKVGAIFMPTIEFKDNGEVDVSFSGSGKYWSQAQKGALDMTHMCSTNAFQNVIDTYLHNKQDDDMMGFLLRDLSESGLLSNRIDGTSSEQAEKDILELFKQYHSLRSTDKKGKAKSMRQIMEELRKSRNFDTSFLTYDEAYQDYGYEKGSGKSVAKNYGDGVGIEDVAFGNLNSETYKSFIDAAKRTMSVKSKQTSYAGESSSSTRSTGSSAEAGASPTPNSGNGGGSPQSTSPSRGAAASGEGQSGPTPSPAGAEAGSPASTPAATAATIDRDSLNAITHAVSQISSDLKPEFEKIHTALKDLGQSTNTADVAKSIKDLNTALTSSSGGSPELSKDESATVLAALTAVLGQSQSLEDLHSIDPAAKAPMVQQFNKLHDTDKACLVNSPTHRAALSSLFTGSDSQEQTYASLIENSEIPLAEKYSLFMDFVGSPTTQPEGVAKIAGVLRDNQSPQEAIPDSSLSNMITLYNTASDPTVKQSIQRLLEEGAKNRFEEDGKGGLKMVSVINP